MHLLQILVLAIVQGAAELLPVSSSAHVIVAEKLMGLDATAPEMTFLLVMLHTGTMFAVIVYFWNAWRRAFFGSAQQLRASLVRVVFATGVTGVVGLALLQIIKHVVAGGRPDYEIEELFGDARVMTAGLAAAGLLILVASRQADRPARDISLAQAGWIGAIQGLCLPFRGFSRSGATISSGMLLGVARRRAEEFSFALAVALTPAVVAREAWRLLKDHALAAQPGGVAHSLAPGLAGLALSFAAGWLALRWLSRWLEQGRWHWFGIYCLVAATVVWRVG
jgi:undecaprenyl-diphosphatase